MATGWQWGDYKLNRRAPLPNTVSTVGNDHTWLGIRKGGTMWARTFRSGASEFIVLFDTEPALPLLISVPPIPTFVNYGVAGLTTNKKNFVICAVDLGSAINVDHLHYVDFTGSGIVWFPVSDGSIGENRQLCYLEHDYYVVAAVEDGWQVKVYDSRATLIRSFTLNTLAANELYGGITTDGKDLYLLVLGEFSSSHRVEKWGVRGEFKGNRLAPGDVERYRTGLSFDGRYLLLLEV